MTVEPARLRIVHYPDPVLRQRAEEVREFTPLLAEIARRMFELMRQAGGIGLAAPQVGLPMRLFVADVPGPEGGAPEGPPVSTGGPKVYVNPVLSEACGDVEPLEEGCLSLPSIRGDVWRPPVVRMTARDLHGEEFTLVGAGLMARCWQHECDHLDGVLIVDKFEAESRSKNRPLVKALERAYRPRG